MKKQLTYVVLTLVAICGLGQHASAQIYDAEGQYVDTVFHDHINRHAEDFVTVSLVVCEPCDILYSTLGHACLHLECPTFGLDYFFSYESESVRDKVWTFLQGDLKMGLFAMTREEFLQSYAEAGRGVKEYKMNLTPTQKQNLWQVMDKHVEEGTNLPYDYFHRGCAKSVVTLVKEAIGSNTIQYAPWSEKYTEQTQREIVRNFIENAPWSEFEMYFLIGTDGDKDYSCEQKLIVPTDLLEVWQQATIAGRPMLEQEAHELIPSVPQKHATWCTPGLLAVVLLVLAVLSLLTVWCPVGWIKGVGVGVDCIILIIQTSIGLIMAYLILFSGLPCTDWNWLIVPFNPLPAIAWRWRKYWALPWAGVLMGWIVAMLVYPHVIVDWPHIVLVLSTTVLYAKQWWLSRK